MSQFFVGGSGGGSGSVTSLTGNDGIAVSPTDGNINIVGNGVSGSGVSSAGNIYVTGDDGDSTLTVNETQAQFLTNYTQSSVNYDVVDTDYLIGCTAANITITLPASPASLRYIVVKDESGGATANPITISGNGNTVNGTSTISIDQNYESVYIYYNGTAWFTY